jgi:hypothetical protein
LHDEPDPLDGLYATLDGHLNQLQSCWTLPVYFDDVLGFPSLPVDLFSFTSEEHQSNNQQFIFDPPLYPPIQVQKSSWMPSKKLQMNRVTRLMTGNHLGVLVCQHIYPYHQQTKDPRDFKENSLKCKTRFGSTPTTILSKITARLYLRVCPKEHRSSPPSAMIVFASYALKIKTQKRDDLNNGYLFIRGGFGCGDHTFHYKVDPQDVRMHASNLDKKTHAIVATIRKARVGLGHAKAL